MRTKAFNNLKTLALEEGITNDLNMISEEIIIINTMDEKVNNNFTNNSILKHLFYLQIAGLNEAYLPGN